MGTLWAKYAISTGRSQLSGCYGNFKFRNHLLRLRSHDDHGHRFAPDGVFLQYLKTPLSYQEVTFSEEPSSLATLMVSIAGSVQ